MYILFLPIKVSLYTCVDTFKVLQHHNNLCHLEEGSNLHSPFGIANTSRPVLILVPVPSVDRDSITPHCQKTSIGHLPNHIGRLYHLPTR